MRTWINLVENSDFDCEEGGWIDTSGEIFSCNRENDYHHADIALNAFEDDDGEDNDYYDDYEPDVDDRMDAMSHAMHQGWIRFGSNAHDEFYIEMTNQPTARAKKALSRVIQNATGYQRYSISYKGDIKYFSDLKMMRSEIAKLG